LFTVPLMFILIPRFGLTGAAYGVIIANTIRLALIMISFPVFLQHRVPRLLVTVSDVRLLFERLRSSVQASQ